MTERSNLQATIDALNKEIAAKNGLIQGYETEKVRYHQFEVDLTHVRGELGQIKKERDDLIRVTKQQEGELKILAQENTKNIQKIKESTEEIRNLGGKIVELTKKSNDFESLYKTKESELSQINVTIQNERNQYKVQIDNLTIQINSLQVQLQDVNQLYMNIRKYEEFINKMKCDIIQFQSTCPPLGGGYTPESAHEHPLIYDEHLKKECKICRQVLNNQPGYRCGNCDITLCLTCSNRVFYGNKNKSAHAHALALKTRDKWRCDVCKKNYIGGASFFCKQCDFDACINCFIK